MTSASAKSPITLRARTLSIRAGREISARRPRRPALRWEFLPAIGHVLAAEYAEAQQLGRRQVGPELRVEVLADRHGSLIAVVLLHQIVDCDGCRRHWHSAPQIGGSIGNGSTEPFLRCWTISVSRPAPREPDRETLVGPSPAHEAMPPEGVKLTLFGKPRPLLDHRQLHERPRPAAVRSAHHDRTSAGWLRDRHLFLASHSADL